MTEVAVLTPDPADPSYAGQWPGVLDRLSAALATAGIKARPTPWTDHVESAHGLMDYPLVLPLIVWDVDEDTGARSIRDIKEQPVYMGDMPLMTDTGTFIINGTERVVVSQLVRSPGVYFDETIDKATETTLHSVTVIPGRGAWLEFDVDKRDTVGVRVDRKRRQPVTVLLKALGWTNEQMLDFIREKGIKCPNCGSSNFTDIRKFNLMFKTAIGVTEDSSSTCYLRPETAQGIFVNFANVQRTTRRKLPFGVCQIGKSFRNEITPGNFTFRTREFEQMELEFFCKPGTELEWFSYWKDYCHKWLLSLGMRDENLRLRDHEQKELSHYSNATTDFEYLFPFGWGELWGVASRTNFDLTQHQNTSGKSLEYFDQTTNEKYLPYVVEPSLGADRVALA